MEVRNDSNTNIPERKRFGGPVCITQEAMCGTGKLIAITPNNLQWKKGRQLPLAQMKEAQSRNKNDNPMHISNGINTAQEIGVDS